EGQSIRLHDRATLQVYRTMETQQPVTILGFNHAGDRLAVNGWALSLELFDVGTGQRLFASPAPLPVIRFSPDDRLLAGALQDGKIGFFQVGDAREHRTLFRKNKPEKVAYFGPVTVSPDGRLLAAGMDDGFGLWDLASGSEIAFVPVGEHKLA